MISYLRLMRFDKPIGTFLLLWPTLWALWIAGNGHPQLSHVMVFIVGVVIMRAAGCVINDLADYKIDGFVKRTKHRPLVTGAVSIKQAWCLFGILCALAGCLLFWLNLLAACIAVIALGLSILYPFSKRFFLVPQVLLGIAWYLGMMMAFAVEQHTLPPIAWALYISAIFWTVAFDTQYAMADREDDKHLDVHSMAILLGRYDKAAIGCFQGAFIGVLGLVGGYLNFHIIYYVFLGISAILLIYHQFLIKYRASDKCLKAFLNNHYIGLLIYAGILLNYTQNSFS